jgi:hypothetical protein
VQTRTAVDVATWTLRVHGEDAAVPSREVTSSPATVTTAGTATDVRGNDDSDDADGRDRGDPSAARRS